MKVRSVGVLSMGKVFGVIHAALGLVGGLFMAAFMVLAAAAGVQQ